MEVHDAPGTETEGRLTEAMTILTGHGYEVSRHDAASAGATDRYGLSARLG